ncbi:hypothetical protein BGX27_005280 [Mortierella sp. AM989]|nr:hypothetical protein BGX27_005280 [Mortierella sp. AM989]
MDSSTHPSRRKFTIVTLIIGVFLFLVAIQVELVPLFRYNPDGDHSNKELEPHEVSPSGNNTIELSQDMDPFQLEGNKEHNPFLTMFPERSPSDQERFLGYLPHSGFHNQRMTLETALRLAAHLNRTLLLPPLYMCEKALNIPWDRPPSLLLKWSNIRRDGVEFCRDYDVTSHPSMSRNELWKALMNPLRDRDMECALYHAWTTTPWTYFYDLPKVLTGVVHIAAANQSEPIRVFDRPNMTIPWLVERLGITENLEKEIYWVNDTVRYDYRILDDSEYDYRLNPELPGKYQQTILLSDLQARQEKIIHFGSLFGPDRVESRSDSHIALANYINNNLDIWNQKILDATKLAETQIEAWIEMTGRAIPGFLGAHLRTADGQFMNVIDRSVQVIVEWVRERVEQDRQYLKEHATPGPAPMQADTEKRQEEDEPTFLDRCMDQPPESPLIFLSTDVHHPRSSPILSDFLDEFPCTMVLSDFPETVKLLDMIHNSVDNVHMLPYMIALMDANMAAKGRDFQGTENSTFSAYISDHLWPEYHPGQHLTAAFL